MPILKSLFKAIIGRFRRPAPVETIVAAEAPVEEACSCCSATPCVFVPDKPKTLQERLASPLPNERIGAIYEALKDMWSWLNTDANYPFLENYRDEWESSYELDAIECETLDIGDDTPVIFRGELMRIRRSIARMRLADVSPAEERIAEMERVVAELDDMTKEDHANDNLNHGEQWLVQSDDREPEGYTKPYDGTRTKRCRCRGCKCEPQQTDQQTAVQEDRG